MQAVGSELLTREYPQHPIASAHAIILRGDRVLLIRRAHEPSKGRWSVPGGMIELGETMREAVQREVREECGIKIEVGNVIDVVNSIVLDESGRVRFHYVVIYLLAQYASGEINAGSDASDACWVTRQESDSLDMPTTVRKIVQQAFDEMP